MIETWLGVSWAQCQYWYSDSKGVFWIIIVVSRITIGRLRDRQPSDFRFGFPDASLRIRQARAD